jgi:hypothetical protein
MFTNLISATVQVPAGTVVRAAGEGGPRFAVTQPGRIEAGAGMTVTLPVRAVAPGLGGNLAKGQLLAVEGELGTQLSAANPQPISGGQDRTDPSPSAADRRLLSERLQAALQQAALEKMQADLAPGDQIIPGSLAFSQGLEESYDPAGDEPADLLSLHRKLEFSARVISAADVRALAQAVLDANLPAGYTPLADTLALGFEPASPAGQEGQAWQLSARRQMRPALPEEEVARLALGLPPQAALSRLSAALPLAGPARIRLTPAWWPRLPIVPFRISVLVSP